MNDLLTDTMLLIYGIALVVLPIDHLNNDS